MFAYEREGLGTRLHILYMDNLSSQGHSALQVSCGRETDNRQLEMSLCKLLAFVLVGLNLIKLLRATAIYYVYIYTPSRCSINVHSLLLPVDNSYCTAKHCSIHTYYHYFSSTVSHPFGILQSVQILSKVNSSRAEASYHGRPSIAPQGVFEESGDFRLTVGDVRGFSLWVPQRTDHIPES